MTANDKQGAEEIEVSEVTRLRAAPVSVKVEAVADSGVDNQRIVDWLNGWDAKHEMPQ